MTIAWVSILIFLSLAIILSANYFVYFSIIHFFSINKKTHRIILLALILLSLSFIAAMAMSRLDGNLFYRTFYLLSGIWLGILFNLLLVSIIIWIIIGLFRLTKQHLNKTMLASILFSLTIIISICGVWNAFHLKITYVTVKIPNLPQSWTNKQIVQISDTHFGIVHRIGLMNKIIKEVNNIKPAAMVITGDLLDGLDGQFSFLTDALNRLQTEKGVYFVTGNHETYAGVKEVFSNLANTQINVLKNEVVDVDGLKFIGISYPEKDEKNTAVAIAQSLQKEFADNPNILLYHSPTNIDEFKNLGVNLQLSGHTHEGQLFPFNYIVRLIYKRSAIGLWHSDDYTLYTTSGAGTWGPAMRTNSHSEIVVITLQ
ncbi:MAG: hypothetical protein COU29_04310 [Candidatus Magasanikbacteria bacterium CG10_big_fil_rev_8_21_14_0_10_36_32]|uniref:Calcineurin-like phosphoesterase domain-containing protein n=1 Tax=Candidatus Magasanikbacteria bacterium CG10_big_fil_rev_8_21_14_0_10_36_32 TaxID=1974646 RepID=A0A2M6W5G2_9BACT|nr:MAG: hypothetical protein COU29_04310 [Candidatus Magasanikbacteria bacterium CG10_big_fil_rev_8_21_14_0_10_36_32]